MCFTNIVNICARHKKWGNVMQQLLSGVNYTENRNYVKELLGVDRSFDVVEKELFFAGLSASYYFIDGFCKDEVMEKIMEYLYKLKADEVPADPRSEERRVGKECL